MCYTIITKGERKRGTKMNVNELQEKLTKLENSKFLHEMKDRWDYFDFEYDRKISTEIREIKRQLAEITK